MNVEAISDSELALFRTMLRKVAGISLSDAKKALVSGRLARRLRHHRLSSYGEYFRLLARAGGEELQIAVDLLTTNESYFFRESKHFDFVRNEVLATHPPGRLFRVWCAACSTGEEPYSVAMLLAERLGVGPWEVLGSDISSRCLETAKQAIYPFERAAQLPRQYLSEYCLKGVGGQEGNFQVGTALRERVRFMQINLNAALPPLGRFDIIFLRNAMIYFDAPVKREVVTRLLPALEGGGYFLVGHSESLHGVTDDLERVRPSVYRKPRARDR